VSVWFFFRARVTANKSNYIDTFLAIYSNTFEFIKELKNTLNKSASHAYFLS
jgi:hypothetical protein